MTVPSGKIHEWRAPLLLLCFDMTLDRKTGANLSRTRGFLK